MKNVLTCSCFKIDKKALEVMRDNAISLELQSSKWSDNALDASQIAKFDDEILLDARPGVRCCVYFVCECGQRPAVFCATTTVLWLVGMLDNFDAVGPLLLEV